MRNLQIDSLQEAMILSDSQVTVADLFSGNIHTESGWSKCDLSEELREDIASIVSEILGGHHKTRAQVKRTLLYCGGNAHWSLKRMILHERGEKYGISYCAGQDYAWECAQARKHLK